MKILQIIAKKFDKDVMTLLLYERRSMITITNAIVQAAAGNARYSLEMMKLEKRGSQFYISREVIMTAARNSSSGSAVLSLLLGKRRQKIEITEKIIETVVTHWDSHDIRLLLKKLRRSFKITQTVLKKAARNEVDDINVIKLFLKNGENKFKIIEKVMIVAAKNFECEMKLIDMLLKKYSDHFKITEALVEAVAESWNENKKMKILLEKASNEVKIIERVLVTVAGNWNGQKTIQLLWDQRLDEIKITDEVLVTAAENEKHSEQMMKLLSQECRFQNEVFEQIITAVAESWDAEKLIMLLFEKWGNRLSVTERVSEAAAANEHSEKILILLLKNGGEKVKADIKVTEGILQAAAENEIYGLEVMKFLLTHCSTQSSITEEVLKAAAANKKLGKELLKLLLEHDVAVISDAVVATAAANGQKDVLQSLEGWNHIKDWREQWFAVSSFYNAVKNGDAEAIKRFLTKDLDPDLDYRGNISPLWIATWNEHFEAVDLLLKTHTVDVNWRSSDGRSPLFCAVERNSEDIAVLLLKNGANSKLTNNKGVTPLELTEQDEHLEMEDIFKKYTLN